MPPFESNPLNSSGLSRALRRNPALFGVPFVLVMVGASYGLSFFTQTKYDLHDQRVSTMSKEQELGLKQDRKKFDIREEYFKLSASQTDDWEPKRIDRPKGLPEWGVAPTEPSAKDGR